MVTASPVEPVRIAFRPQTWLFVANLVIQPAMTALFGWMAVGVDGSIGARIFEGVMALVTCALFVFSLLAVVRTWGKHFELIVTADELTVPHPVLGRVWVIPFSALRVVHRIRTRAGPTSFWMLQLEWMEGPRKRMTTVSSQLVGDDAFTKLCSALEERGVRVGS